MCACVHPLSLAGSTGFYRHYMKKLASAQGSVLSSNLKELKGGSTFLLSDVNTFDRAET